MLSNTLRWFDKLIQYYNKSLPESLDWNFQIIDEIQSICHSAKVLRDNLRQFDTDRRKCDVNVSID